MTNTDFLKSTLIPWSALLLFAAAALVAAWRM